MGLYLAAWPLASCCSDRAALVIAQAKTVIARRIPRARLTSATARLAAATYPVMLAPLARGTAAQLAMSAATARAARTVSAQAPMFRVLAVPATSPATALVRLRARRR